LILALQTTTFGTYGGISTYNRLVCRALNELEDAEGSRVLIAMDEQPCIEQPSSSLSRIELEAFSGNRAKFIKRVMALAFRQKFDIALIGHVNHAPLGLMLKLMQPQMRYGVMIYGIDVWRHLKGFQSLAMHRADFIVSISDYTRQRAIEANDLAPERFFLLPNALERHDSEPTRIDHPAIKGTLLLSVCRLEKSEQYKGVDKVIEALPSIASHVPDVQYIVIGGGTDLERHKELADRVGVAERVHFLGFVDDETLQAYYRACDLFVMPSAGEGFGFVFLEAMQYSKAVVAANSGGAPEVVVDGETGLLVEYGDTTQLTAALIRLCLDSEFRAKLGSAGYKRLQENFTFPKFRQTFSDILKQELSAAETYKSRRQSIGKTRAV